MRLERGHRYRVVVLATVLAVVLAACGNGRGDDDDSSSGNGSSTVGRRRARAAASTSTPRNCPTDPSTVALSGDTITIGTSLPQSGIYAAFSAILNGEKAYFDYINDAKGGVEIAGKKYKIKLDAQGRRVRRAEDGHQRAVARQRATRSSHCSTSSARRTTSRSATTVNAQCVPEPVRGIGAAQWGNHDVPVAASAPSSCRTRSRCRRSSTT